MQRHHSTRFFQSALVEIRRDYHSGKAPREAYRQYRLIYLNALRNKVPAEACPRCSSGRPR